MTISITSFLLSKYSSTIALKPFKPSKVYFSGKIKTLQNDFASLITVAVSYYSFVQTLSGRTMFLSLHLELEATSSVALSFSLELVVDIFSTSFPVSSTESTLVKMITSLLGSFSECLAAALRAWRCCLYGPFLAYR